MKKYSLLITVKVFTLVFLASCAAPIPIARLSPQVPEKEKRFWFGKEQLTLKSREIQMSVSFLESSASELVFCLEIINHSDKDILIEPEKAFFEVISTESIQMSKTIIYALDPEERILNVDKQISLNNARASDAASLELVSLAVDMTAEILADSDTERLEAEQEYDNNRIIYQNESIAYENRLLSLNEERDYWLNHTIRKTHLPPNTSIKGTLIFPRHDAALFLKWNFPTEGINFAITYEQELIKAR